MNDKLMHSEPQRQKEILDQRALEVNDRIAGNKAIRNQLTSQLNEIKRICMERYGTDDISKLRKLYSKEIQLETQNRKEYEESIHNAEILLNQIDEELNQIEIKYAKS